MATQWSKWDKNLHPEQRADLLQAHRVPWGELMGKPIGGLNKGFARWVVHKHDEFEPECPWRQVGEIIEAHYPQLLIRA